MLYNEAWSKSKVEVKADPFSLESLIAWLEKMPIDRVYDYIDSSNCILCQYFRASGVPVYTLSGNVFDLKSGGKEYEFPYLFQSIARDGSETFGAALTRAREALASRA